VRDAGRVLEIPYGVVDKIAKAIPEGPGQTLDACLKPGQELKVQYDADPVAREIVDLAKPLEGLVRADSIHAAGVVIGDQPLTEYVPLQQKGADQEVVTQFAGGDVEALGLLKIDFLGLRNLDVLEKAKALVGNGLDYSKVPLDDKKVYTMLSKGESTGVFQFESSGMREALRQVKPTQFEDLIALVALYRPGPMGYIPVYARRKAGQEQVSYIDPRLKAITEHTYGICLSGDSLVFDAVSGRRRRLDQLDEHDDVVVQGVDEDFSPTHARITAWMDNGVKPVYRLRLKNGSSLKATANHEFLTEGGWRPLDDLAPGDFIATPQKLSLIHEGRTLSTSERARMKVLAYLLGDGSLSGNAPPCFYSKDELLLADFEQACGVGFEGVALSRREQDRGVIRLTAARGVDAPYHSASELEMWLRDLGLRWKLSDLRARGTNRKGPRSQEKWVPEEIFELADEEIGRFLAAIWDCDGYVGKQSVFYKTISQRLASDVQTLLLRLGIRSSIYESRYDALERGRSVERRAYQVTPHGTQRFAELVQLHMITAKAAVRTYADDGSLTVAREPALQEILAATKDLRPVGTQRSRGGRVSMKGLSAQIGIDAQHFYPQNRSRRRIDCRCVAPVANSFDLPSTTRSGRIAWGEIVSIEPAGVERVYDITVEGIHNFVANNVIAHNCIYQEQAMEIAKQLAGFTPAEADDLRKAIGKKIHSLMLSLKEKFLAGCAENGVTPSVAHQLWNDIEASKDYSFNKSHAACYALIAYRTAWMRAHHPREYMAALISSVMNTKDRVPFYVNACDEMGIEVLPPDVNESQLDFAVVEGKIRFGLSAVKNVGEPAARAIIRARDESGDFASIWEFCERVDPAAANKRALDSLVKCGALDSTGATRMGMLAALERALGAGAARQQEALFGQESMFEVEHPAIPPEEFEKGELLRLEKEVLGLYVSEHPLHSIRDQLRRKTDCALADVERRRDGEVVTVGGIVSALKHLTTKKGEPMVFMRLDDVTGGAEVVVFNSVYAQSRELCVMDRILVVKGRIDHKQEGETKLLAMEVAPFEAVAERREVTIKIDARRARAGIVRDLAALVKDFPGDSRVTLVLEMSEGTKQFVLGPQYKVKPVPDFFAEAKALLGEAAVL